MTALRQISVKVVLAAAFAGSIFLLLTPLLAEVQFDAAGKLIAEYLWKDAEARLELAVKIDPCDSRYPARLGEFLFEQSSYKNNRTQLLNKAEERYGRAAALNPECAEYHTKLGQIKILTFLDGTSKVGLVRDAFTDFKKAVRDDPNGFSVAYAVGYPSLAAWKYLDGDERALVIDRLKYSLKQKPWYSQYIYPQVLRMTEDPKLLEAIMPEVEAKQWVDLKKVGQLKDAASQAKVTGTILRPDWKGADPGGNVYENGNMYWSGTIYGAILLPEGNALIIVEARGSPAEGIYPYMLVSLDGKKIGSVYVDSAESKKYSFPANTGGGVKVLGITFTNDGGNRTEDRNLYIGNAQAG